MDGSFLAISRQIGAGLAVWLSWQVLLHVLVPFLRRKVAAQTRAGFVDQIFWLPEPHFDDAVTARRGKPSAIRTKCDRPYIVIMVYVGEPDAMSSIPYLGGMVSACRDEPLTVGAEGDIIYPVLMMHDGKFFTGGGVPNLDLIVGSFSSQFGSIGAEEFGALTILMLHN